MSPNKKRSTKKHFLETDAGFNRLLRASKKDVPSETTLAAIRDHAIRTGKLRETLTEESAGFYLQFIAKVERKTDREIANELNVDLEDLKYLKVEGTKIDDRSLFEFCMDFVQERPAFTLRPMFTLLKRAMVLHSMTSGKTTLRKAARKKPQK